MKRTNTLMLSIAIVAAASAFFVTLGAGPGPGDDKASNLSRLLDLTDDQRQAIHRTDPTFEEQAAELTARMQAAQEALAQTLQDDNSTDAQVLDKVEDAITAHNELERRVARHLLLIRTQLQPRQRTQLMDLCAEGVRSGQRHRYRHGQQQTDGHGNANNQGRGRYRGGRGD